MICGTLIHDLAQTFQDPQIKAHEHKGILLTVKIVKPDDGR
jgi:hypothetical protein